VCEATCPRGGEPTLWAKPIPRHVTFHGTRHSGGTAVIKKAGIAGAQKFLRHSDVRITVHTHGHLDTEDVRAGLDKTFGPAPDARVDCCGLHGHATALRTRPSWSVATCGIRRPLRTRGNPAPLDQNA
jgi:hypothetical protein